MHSCGPLHMDEQRQDDQLEPTYNCSVPIQDVAFKTYRKRGTIEKGGEISVRHDDDDIWLSKAHFSTGTIRRCRRGHYSFHWIAPLTLDSYLIMLSVKQGGINYHFVILWYDSTWDWTPKVRSPDGDTEYFDIVAGVLQGDTLGSYLFIICLDYVLRTSMDKIKVNGFELTKKRSRRYLAKTITDADYADDIAILANTPNQAETLLHSLERTAVGMGLHVNAHKTEYMCFNQTDEIFHTRPLWNLLTNSPN